MNAESLTATKNELLAELHKDVFLTPKGMLKLVQLFVVICAFAMTTSATGITILRIRVGSVDGNFPVFDVTGEFSTSYPFSEYSYKRTVANVPDGKVPKVTDSFEEGLKFKDGFSSESGFYVFVGVISFLYVLAAIISYAWYNKFEKMSQLFAQWFTKVDFVVTGVLAFLWFLSVTLWSAGFSALRRDVDPPYLFPVLLNQIETDPLNAGMDVKKLCPGPHFSCVTGDSWSKLYGSVVFGYLCILLFAVNCWYCFKDTEWHAEPDKLGNILRIRTDEPAAGPAAGMQDVNLEVGDSATIQPGAI